MNWFSGAGVGDIGFGWLFYNWELSMSKAGRCQFLRF